MYARPSMFWMNAAAVIAAGAVVALAAIGLVVTFCDGAAEDCLVAGGGEPVLAAPLPTPNRATTGQQGGGTAVQLLPQPSGVTAVGEQGGIIIDLVAVPPTAVPPAATGWDWAENMSDAARERIVDQMTDELPVGIAAPGSGSNELPIGIAAPTPAGGSDCNRVDAPLFCASRAGEGRP